MRGARDAERLIAVRLTPLARSDGGQSIVAPARPGRRLQTQERLTRLANYDSLTGLPNRALFRDRLSRRWPGRSAPVAPMALMFLDLDRFKLINDSLGHEAGDRLLQHVARTLTHCLRDVDSVAHGRCEGRSSLSRLGGDEFTVIAEDIGSAEDAALVARRLLDALARPFVLGDEEEVVSASIGISMYPADDVDLDTLIAPHRHGDVPFQVDGLRQLQLLQ